MKLNNDYAIKAPNEVHLDQCEFKHFFYAMNSLVGLTDVWGRVTITQTHFHDISICGPIVKNYFSDLGAKPELKNFVNSEFLSHAQKTRIEEAWGLEDQFGFTPNANSPADLDTSLLSCSDCFEIVIESSQFNDIPFDTGDRMSEVPLVSSANGQQHSGAILGLNNFEGKVMVVDSLFENN